MELPGRVAVAGSSWCSSPAIRFARDQRALPAPPPFPSHVPQEVEPCLAHPTLLAPRTCSHDLRNHDRLVLSCLDLLVRRAHSNRKALPFCALSLRDPYVKVNDVQRVAAFAIPVLRPSITRRVVARMRAAFAIKAKTNSERHRLPQSSPCEL